MDQPSLESEVQVDLPEHQILLSFVNDYDALQFSTWWGDKGFPAFSKWAECHDQYGDKVRK